MEVLLICDLGEVLHDWFEARMVGGGLEAGLRLRLRPRLVLRLVLEALVSQTALPCSNSGERRGSISSAYLGGHGRAHEQTESTVYLSCKTSQAATNTARRGERKEERRKTRRSRMQRDEAGGR